LVVPKLFETLCGSLYPCTALGGIFPQKMTLAPNGDLILSNIYRADILENEARRGIAPERLDLGLPSGAQ